MLKRREQSLNRNWVCSTSLNKQSIRVAVIKPQIHRRTYSVCTAESGHPGLKFDTDYPYTYIVRVLSSFPLTHNKKTIPSRLSLVLVRPRRLFADPEQSHPQCLSCLIFWLIKNVLRRIAAESDKTWPREKWTSVGLADARRSNGKALNCLHADKCPDRGNGF